MDDFLNDFQGEILEGIIDILIMHSDSISEFTTEPSGPPLVSSVLSSISDDEDYWLHVIECVIKKVPNYAINIIKDIIRDIPCPTVETVNIMFVEQYELTVERANNPHFDRKIERNICVVLACLADKLTGDQSMQIFSQNMCNYLFQFFLSGRKSILTLVAFLALEKFAVTSDNKTKIETVISKLENNPLLYLLEYADSDDNMWRQIGFCARWALDNTFPIPGRLLSYLTVNMTHINVIFNQNNQMFMKISPDGLEVRCDTYYFGTVRATCEVGQGAWYFEVTFITGGPMRVGLATTASNMSDTYAIGRDNTSVGYDGSTRMLWCDGKSRYLFGIDVWKAGDVMGFFVNTITKKLHLIQRNATVTISLPVLFDDPDGTKKFIPAVTMAPYEQCRFNFGAEPFVCRTPEEWVFLGFNDSSRLTPEQKMVKPRSVFQSENSKFNDSNDACEVCYDNTANVKLVPCGHNTFCSECVSKIEICPICRVDIIDRV